MSWYYDDEEVRRYSGNAVSKISQRDHHLMMNFWIPSWDKWHNGFDPAEMPWYARYDWVEVYDYTGDENDPFSFRWRDNFDTFDYSRWKKSNNWSFNDNQVTFMDHQVYTENGELVLKLQWKTDPVEDPSEDEDEEEE